MDPQTDDAWMQFLPGNMQQDDQSCIARFFLKPYLLGLKSREAGREIYEDREFVEIMVKGQPQQVVHEQVKPDHIRRFPNAYAAFKTGQDAPVVGTPVEKLGISPSQVLNWKQLGIRTVEDVAAASDEVLQRMGPGSRATQDKAKMLVQGNASQVEALQARIAELEALVKPKRKYERKAVTQ